MSLENRVAVITGATGGLGSTLARELASLGLNLALLDIDPARLDTLVQTLSLPASRIFTRTVDLLDPAGTKSAASAILAKFGKIDILLHVVGGWTGGKTLFEAPADDLAFMLNQHVWTSFNVIQAFVPLLVSNGWGRVAMVTSPFASRPNAKGGPYAVGKAGQEASCRLSPRNWLAPASPPICSRLKRLTCSAKKFLHHRLIMHHGPPRKS